MLRWAGSLVVGLEGPAGRATTAASTTNHSEIRGLRRASPAQRAQDCFPSGAAAVYVRRFSCGRCLPHWATSRAAPDGAEVVRLAGLSSVVRGRGFCRRYADDLAVEQRPDEARELVSTRGHRHVAMLAARDQPPVRVVLAPHRTVGQRHQVGRVIRPACSQGRPDMHRLLAVWCSLRQRRPQASMAGSREAAASHHAARGLAHAASLSDLAWLLLEWQSSGCVRRRGHSLGRVNPGFGGDSAEIAADFSSSLRVDVMAHLSSCH